jgi:hypothetical protein
MKIDEIVISDKKITFDRITNNDITDKTVMLFNLIKSQTNGFTELAHERYPPNDIHDLTELALEINNEMIQYFQPSSQTYKIIEWLLYYLKV